MGMRDSGMTAPSFSHVILIGKSPADTMQATPARRPETRSTGKEKGWTIGETGKKRKVRKECKMIEFLVHLPTTLMNKSRFAVLPSSSVTAHWYWPASAPFSTLFITKVPLRKTFCRWFWGSFRPSFRVELNVSVEGVKLMVKVEPDGKVEKKRKK